MNCFLKLSLIFVLSFSFSGANASEDSDVVSDEISALIGERDEIVAYLDEVTSLQNESHGYGENDALLRTSRDDLIDYLEELIAIHDELISVQQKISNLRDSNNLRQKDTSAMITSISLL